MQKNSDKSSAKNVPVRTAVKAGRVVSTAPKTCGTCRGCGSGDTQAPVDTPVYAV